MKSTQSTPLIQEWDKRSRPPADRPPSTHRIEGTLWVKTLVWLGSAIVATGVVPRVMAQPSASMGLFSTDPSSGYVVDAQPRVSPPASTGLTRSGSVFSHPVSTWNSVPPWETSSQSSRNSNNGNPELVESRADFPSELPDVSPSPEEFTATWVQSGIETLGEVDRIDSAIPGASWTTIPGTTVYGAEDSVSSGQYCQPQLAEAIDRVLQKSTFASGDWGIKVVSLQTGATLYSHNPDQYLIPASNIKLFTSAAALQLQAQAHKTNDKTFSDLITRINRWSNNEDADALLRKLGGSEAVMNALMTLGIDPLNVHQVDGSGLSRRNAVTATAIVNLLQAMTHSPNAQFFENSLAVAGESGTLRNRLRATPAQGTVRAKTGTLRGVRALSGYLDHPEFGPLVFSILVNHPTSYGTELVDGIDGIIIAVARHSC